MMKLRRERLKRALTQSGLAALSGLTQSTISAVEHERLRPGPGQRARIARAMGMPEAELFTPDVDPEPAARVDGDASNDALIASAVVNGQAEASKP